MIGRADIEGSKSNVAMNAWLPQAVIPCGNFSDTSCLKLLKSKGSIGHAFTVCIRTENQNQASFWPFALREVSVLAELALGHLLYLLTDVPPQSTPRLTLSSERIATDPAAPPGEEGLTNGAMRPLNSRIEGLAPPLSRFTE
nr:senescence-associated protein; partial [Biomphalaria glabrata]